MGVYQDKKSKKWYVKRSWYDIDGKRHYLTRRGFKTKREAEKADNKLAVEIDDGIDVTENPIFANCYDDWVKTYKKGNVAPNTLIEYNLEGKRIRKLLGAAKIKNINRSKYQKIINEFGENHAKNSVKNCIELSALVLSQQFKMELLQETLLRISSWHLIKIMI